ncbi:MAG: phosphoglucosamine mutase [Methylococcales bacterium]|jgi:phosphoglucosamine mutase|nr:phosphoglucosamine mutase [Methylococcales bacterium]MBT4349145.1 phosphoglucosamine mutase [Methylococcales bacterium]MBT4766233.1 phosphoglucosamine mutase [Methylococcales bacterium]MBT5436631.1 phosphoglucosamine mutase [Methylococcales bacterium]MBT5952704.1 phosphoglucosamine mutase [Methylococcales bacterium]
MASKKRYFGTDGIRGRVGVAPITAEFMLKLGWAIGKVFSGEGKNMVLVGKDTRISGYMFESALEAGLTAAGVDTRLIGPMPTPAIAYLTRTFRAQAGIVISASHNPYYDNGIKLFSTEGIKLKDDVEHRIEAFLENPMTTVDSAQLGKARRIVDAAGRYIEFCKGTISPGVDFKGMRIVVDCAQGATYHVAPHVFSEVGAEVMALADAPDGININDECGATAPQNLSAKVLEYRADFGIALDGDGDRLIMVDHTGAVVDGDELLFIIARSRHEQKQLKGPVVGTLMTNLGMEHALAGLGIDFLRAKVGDRYVMEMLSAHGGMLGGEGSGHIICLDKTTTGDGIVAALQIIEEIKRTGKTLHELKQGMEKYPQTLINVKLSGSIDLNVNATIQEKKKAVEMELGGDGRVLLRTSGTEPLVRVMVEGKDVRVVSDSANALANTVKEVLSA